MLRTNINGIAVIYEGDPTTSGGWVLEGSAGYVENGNRLALKGHAVWCPACESTGHIAEGNSSLTVSDIPVALEGHRVDCGCPVGSVTLIASTLIRRSAESVESILSPASLLLSSATQNSTCRDVPNTEGTGIVVSECSFCPNCIMEECDEIDNMPNRELIKEVNIRLAGFGGCVPTDLFTAQTTKAIKQFQRDYMGLPTSEQTGFLCRSVIEAIDRFGNEYPLPAQVFTGNSLCPCTRGTSGNRCTGFGSDGNNEYPGFHRSLCWMLKAAIFYMSENGNYTFREIYSGYRCNYDNIRQNRRTINHMGHAFDIHFNGSNGQRDRGAQAIRNAIFIPHIGASETRAIDIFYLEPNVFRNGSAGATSWVHIDSTQFDADYKVDSLYVQTIADVNGETLDEITRRVAATVMNCSKT